MQVLGVHFVPWNEPLKNHLQALGVAHFTYLFMFIGYSMILGWFYLLLFTNFWFLSLAYAAWVYYDKETPKQGGRIVNWVKR